MPFRDRPVQDADQATTIHLTPHELETLQKLVVKDGDTLSPTELIEAFVADLTGSWRTNGSDEREYAFAWFKWRASDYIEAVDALDWLEE